MLMFRSSRALFSGFTLVGALALVLTIGTPVPARASAATTPPTASTATVHAAASPGSAAITLPAWNASVVYASGDQVIYEGSTWKASWWTQGEVPGANSFGAWQQIAASVTGMAVWEPSRIFTAGDTAVYRGAVYTAKWWTRDQVPGDANGPWQPGPNGDIVATASGQVHGNVADGYRDFLAIPYAAPPVGSLQWAPPAPRASWSGVRDATQQRPQCPQNANPLEGTGWSGDCLDLNVWTPPVSDSKDLPVIMFIHGGAHDHSSGRIFDGSRMAKEGNAVVVTINYRLGVFGNLALSQLDNASSEGSGSFGLMDQVAALKWIHTNIAAFGGDPDRVAIDGQSSGAADVCSLLASPPAAGLFSSAIIESASCSAHSQSFGLSQGASFAKKVGCIDSATVVTCLRSKATADLVTAEAHISWGPSVGGAYLPQVPLDAFASGTYNRVPVIKGATHDEDRFTERDQGLSSSGFTSRIHSQYSSQADTLLAAYPVASYSSPLLAWATVESDQSACQTRTLDGQLSLWFPLFTYEFDDPNAPNYPGVVDPNLPLGPTHTSELAYLFDLFGKSAPFDALQKNLAHQMIEYWATFAATGTPTPTNLPAMQQYNVSDDTFLSLRPTGNTTITNYAADHHCEIWDQIG